MFQLNNGGLAHFALLVVATEVATRERLIAAGLERARLFTWERAGRALADLYRALATARA